jgi:hypothetical protein
MSSTRVTRWLSWAVGGILILMGCLEVGVRAFSGDPIDWTAIAYWGVSLIGGGLLVLLGSFWIERPGVAWAALIVGCFLGIQATIWTMVVPLLAVVLLVMRVRNAPGAKTATE